MVRLPVCVRGTSERRECNKKGFFGIHQQLSYSRKYEILQKKISMWITKQRNDFINTTLAQFN